MKLLHSQSVIKLLNGQLVIQESQLQPVVEELHPFQVSKEDTVQTKTISPPLRYLCHLFFNLNKLKLNITFFNEQRLSYGVCCSLDANPLSMKIPARMFKHKMENINTVTFPLIQQLHDKGININKKINLLIKQSNVVGNPESDTGWKCKQIEGAMYTSIHICITIYYVRKYHLQM